MTYISDSVVENQAALPHSMEAEQSLLGALLFDNTILEHLAGLEAAHFHYPAHARIFTAIEAVIAGGGVADGVTLKGRFAEDGGLAEIGGAGYLLTLMEAAAPLASQAAAYAGLIRDHAMRRALIKAGEAAVALGRKPPEDWDAGDLVVEVQRSFDAIAGQAAAPLISLGEAAQAFIANLDAPKSRAVPTGFSRLDEKLGGGMHREDLIILAGRPSIGKTALANNIARTQAKAGFKVGMISHEMSASSIAQRALAATSYWSSNYGYEKYAYSHLRNGAPNVDRALLSKHAAELMGLPLLIDDRPGLTVQQVEWSFRAMRRQLGGLDVGVIDYLQIMGRPENRKGRNDAAILGEMTGALKGVARSLNIALIILCQLSRQVEGRDDKRPQLSDLRESGAIEQDADVVISVYREAYYLERAEPRADAGGEKLRAWTEHMERVRDVLELNVLKNRQGPIGSVELRALVQHDVVLDGPPKR